MLSWEPTPPESPLAPGVGEPGYVSSATVIDELARAFEVVSRSVTDRAHVVTWQVATDALSDMRLLIQVLGQRTQSGRLVDVRDGANTPTEPCTYTHAHTRKWCGNPTCREA